MTIFTECSRDDFRNEIEWLASEFLFQNVSPSFVHGFLCSYRPIIVCSSETVKPNNKAQIIELGFVTLFNRAVDNFHSMTAAEVVVFLNDLLGVLAELDVAPDEDDESDEAKNHRKEQHNALVRENKALNDKIKELNEKLRAAEANQGPRN